LSGVAHRPQALLKAKEEREKQVAAAMHLEDVSDTQKGWLQRD
jgi:hypothetical protein